MAEHQNIAVNYTYWGHMANFPNSPHSIIATDWGPYSNYSLVVTIAVDHTAAADRIAVEIGPHNCMRASSMNYCYCWLGKACHLLELVFYYYHCFWKHPNLQFFASVLAVSLPSFAS